MAASRASTRALSRFAAGSKQVRSLHMTGPATFPSPMLTSERPAVNLPRDVAALRAECKKRRLPTTGSKAELMDRLSADELPQTRSLSTAVKSERRPEASSSSSSSSSPPSQPVRHFNTSRALKTVNDSSTIDFAYLPEFNYDADVPAPRIRVPLLPSNFFPAKTGGVAYGEEADISEVMRPQISTVAADGTFINAPSAMSEVHDNSAMDIDYASMVDKVAAATRRAAEVESEQGTAKQVWNGLMDDLFGPKK